MKNIILIGMPGAGKSTVGVVLAKRLGYQFVDSDLVIQQREGRLLHEIISMEGIDGFLKIEELINASLMSEESVIATGGSVVYGQDAMKHLKDLGTVVYLRMTYEGIVERLGDLKERGVVCKEGLSLYDLYEERVPLYEAYADQTINCDGKSIRDIIEEIVMKSKDWNTAGA